MSFIQKKTMHGLGEYSASPAEEHSSWGILGKNEFYRVLEEAMRIQGMIAQEVGDILIRRAGPIFSGKVSSLKLSWRIAIGIH